MSDLAAALQIAIRVHADQRDKQGEPYLLHVLRVVEAVSDAAKPVAALHDVLVDDQSGSSLMSVGAKAGLSRGEEEALGLLTRLPDETYADYIARMAVRDDDWHAAPLARVVKLADLRDNLGRIPAEVDGDRSPVEAAKAHIAQSETWEPLKRRYEKAIATLEATQ